ncbi:unnamed protein product [Clonostachys rosea]|uniref:Uncharacterized protein n=1 Tax=Bionectria ochroleuca TaxID=29856 RepID=A0ABY6UXX7_BIOOC|nr:unnamed protein product [Clonostachys rosea]
MDHRRSHDGTKHGLIDFASGITKLEDYVRGLQPSEADLASRSTKREQRCDSNAHTSWLKDDLTLNSYTGTTRDTRLPVYSELMGLSM